MKTFKHIPQFITLREDRGRHMTAVYEVLSQNDNAEYPYVLRHLVDGDISNHRLYNENGLSYWKEIPDK